MGSVTEKAASDLETAAACMCALAAEPELCLAARLSHVITIQFTHGHLHM